MPLLIWFLVSWHQADSMWCCACRWIAAFIEAKATAILPFKRRVPAPSGPCPPTPGRFQTGSGRFKTTLRAESESPGCCFETYSEGELRHTAVAVFAVLRSTHEACNLRCTLRVFEMLAPHATAHEYLVKDCTCSITI